MTSCIRTLFIALVILLQVLLTGLTIAAFTFYNGNDEAYAFLFLFGGPFLLLYAMTSALAVWLFVRILLRLAANQATLSRTNVLEAPSLNKHQLKMLRQSTKYLSLFLVAVTSTLITIVPGF